MITGLAIPKSLNELSEWTSEERLAFRIDKKKNSFAFTSSIIVTVPVDTIVQIFSVAEHA